jgi:hypothetical protein
MPYTRRAVLKDAALLAVAGTTGYWIKGCNTKPTATRPNYFAPGVRIFFEGTWLFCADPTPNSNLMRAVTLDIPAEAHYFPYGRWSPSWNAAADQNLPQLPLYKDPSVPPPTVTVAGFSSASTINALFSNAQHDSPFTYLPTKSAQKYAFNWNASGIRVLSMPVPTRIIPAGYNTGASISDPKGHCQKYPTTCRDIGVATTHIFEYQGAESLVFALDLGTTVSQAQDSTGDYHFHSVPQGVSMASNAALMLDALLQVINSFPHGDVTLNAAAAGSPIEIGPNVPNCVGPEELEIFPDEAKNPHTMFALPNTLSVARLTNGDFATCGGGGIGVGD